MRSRQRPGPERPWFQTAAARSCVRRRRRGWAGTWAGFESERCGGLAQRLVQRIVVEIVRGEHLLGVLQDRGPAPHRPFAESAPRDRTAASSIDKEEIGGGDGVAQQLDALANERRDRDAFFRSCVEACAARRRAPARSLSSSTGSARMCSAFSQTALGSKGSSSVKLTTALERLTPSSVKASVSSSSVMNSRSFLGDQPSRHRKLMNACGRKPGIAIGGDADHRAVLALRKLGAIGRNQQRQMRETAAARRRGLQRSARA